MEDRREAEGGALSRLLKRLFTVTEVTLLLTQPSSGSFSLVYFSPLGLLNMLFAGSRVSSSSDATPASAKIPKLRLKIGSGGEARILPTKASPPKQPISQPQDGYVPGVTSG